MELFKPQLTLLPQLDKIYDLLSVTLTPTSCYSGGPARVGLPPGYVVTPETVPVTLELRHRGSLCLQVITPVRHFLPGIKLGRDVGKTRVTAFAVLDGKVLGISSISVDEAMDVEAAHQLGLGKDCFPTFDWYAWDNQMPGATRSLHVTGTVIVPSTCYAATLEQGVVANPPPGQFPLILKVEKHPGPCLPVVTNLSVRFDQKDYRGGYETVGIYQADCEPIVVEIEEVH
ncbi:MAG: hypothetical protein AAGD38_15405 [Acidobacteriota bacterium]